MSGTYTRIPSPPPRAGTRIGYGRTPGRTVSGSVAGQGCHRAYGQDVVLRGQRPRRTRPFVDQPERVIYIPVPAGVQGEQGHPVLEAVRHGPADQALHLVEVLVPDQQLAPHVQVVEAAVRAPGDAHRDAIGAEAAHHQIDLGVLFRLRPVLIRLRPVLTPVSKPPPPIINAVNCLDDRARGRWGYLSRIPPDYRAYSMSHASVISNDQG